MPASAAGQEFVDHVVLGRLEHGVAAEVGVAGVSGQTLVVNLASSRAAVRDGMATITPLATHVIEDISEF